VRESITVERIRHTLVIGQSGADAVALAEALPPVRGRTAVLVGASAVPALARLDPWVVADLEEAASGGLLLVAPNLGAMGESGALPPARLLADRLGVEVVAADGIPCALADRTLFVRGAGWLSYRPDGSRRPLGTRFPAPVWQHGVADVPGATEIPAGLWIRVPAGSARPTDPVWWRAPDPDRMYVVLGATDEPQPDAPSVAEVLRSLPAEARNRAVLSCYGADGLAQAVADELAAPVRVAHGQLTYMDGQAGSWRPFAVESVHRPGVAPVLDRWIAPAPTMTMVEPASYRLIDDWLVDVVPRGLLARPANLLPDPAWPGETGSTAELLIAAADTVPGPVVTALDELLRALPDDARTTLRIIPTSPAAATAATALELADRVVAPADTVWQVPAASEPPTGAVVVTPQGRVLPADAILAIDVPEPANPPALPAVAATAQAPTAQADRPPSAAPPVGRLGDAPNPAPLAPAVPADPRPGSASPSTDRLAEEAPPAYSLTGAVAVAESAPSSVLPAAAVSARSVVPHDAAPRELPRAGVAPVVAVESTATATAPPAVAVDAAAAMAATTASATAPVAARHVDSVVGLLPTSAATEPPPAARPIEVPADACSTVEQRRSMRGKLGSRYDVATRAVTRLLSERPGLRAGATDPAALLTELAVVRVFADDPDSRYDNDFYVCLAGGLRRLPTTRAVVVRGIPEDTEVAPEAVLRLPVPVVAAATSLDHRAGAAEALIWTTTARRLDGLLDTADVVLSAHTRLRVLGVDAGPVRRVLLAEDGTPREAALDRLRAAVDARAELRDQPVATRWFGALPAA